MVLTFKERFNKKYGFPKDQGHSLSEISRLTGFSLKGLNMIFKKGIGAFRTNPQSVRPTITSAEAWAQSRVYSAVMGGPASKVDAKELAM
jgi:hypothetical protein